MNQPYEVEIIVSDAKEKHSRHLEIHTSATNPENAASEVVAEVVRGLGPHRARIVTDDVE